MRLTAILAVVGEHLVDLVTNFTLRELDIVLGAAIVIHQRKETVIGDVELVHIRTCPDV